MKELEALGYARRPDVVRSFEVVRNVWGWGRRVQVVERDVESGGVVGRWAVRVERKWLWWAGVRVVVTGGVLVGVVVFAMDGMWRWSGGSFWTTRLPRTPVMLWEVFLPVMVVVTLLGAVLAVSSGRVVSMALGGAGGGKAVGARDGGEVVIRSRGGERLWRGGLVMTREGALLAELGRVTQAEREIPHARVRVGLADGRVLVVVSHSDWRRLDPGGHRLLVRTLSHAVPMAEFRKEGVWFPRRFLDVYSTPEDEVDARVWAVLVALIMLA